MVALKIFAHNLKKYRKKVGLSQEDSFFSFAKRQVEKSCCDKGKLGKLIGWYDIAPLRGVSVQRIKTVYPGS